MKSLVAVAAFSTLLASSAIAQTTSPLNSSQMDSASSSNDIGGGNGYGGRRGCHAHASVKKRILPMRFAARMGMCVTGCEPRTCSRERRR